MENTDFIIEPISSNKEWGNWADTDENSSPFHQPVYPNIVAEHYGHENAYLGVRQAGILQGVIPLMQARQGLLASQIVSMPYAGLTDRWLSKWLSEGNHEEKLSAVGKCCESHYRLSPELRFQQTETLIQAGLSSPSFFCEYDLALPPCVETCWESTIRSKTRNTIRRAQKSNYEIKWGAKDLLEDFYALYSQRMHELGSPVHAKPFFSSLLQAFPNSMAIVVAYAQNKPLASSWLWQHGKSAGQPWAASCRESRASAANSLVYWESLVWAINHGARTFHLGRSVKGSSHAAFKLRWGANETAFAQTLIQEGKPVLHQAGFDRPWFKLAQSSWRHLPKALHIWLSKAVISRFP